jgi:fatty-acyl-CoA synthase
MDVFQYARTMTGLGVSEARGLLDVARTGAVRPIAPSNGVSAVRALRAYGPIGALAPLAAALYGDRPGLIDERGSLSFSELDRRSNAVAHALRARGLRGGDVVGVLCRNHRGLLDALFGTGKLGLETLLLNTDFSAPQLRDVCARENVTLVIHDEEFAEIVGRFDPPAGRVLAWHDGSDRLSLDQLIETGPSTAPPRPSTRPKLVLLTSGTTGTPKGAARDVGLRLAVPGGFLHKIPYRTRRSVLVAAPVFHAWGLANSLAALGLGSTLILHRHFDPVSTLQSLAEHDVDTLVTIPILLSRLLAVPHRPELPQLRIIALSGSALSAELGTRAMDAFGDIVYNLYGSTEVAYASIATPADLRAAPGSVGRPPYGTTLRLYDEDGREVPAGATGRIFVGNGAQFEGYTGGGGKPVIDGLMATGDVGHFDSAGYLHVDGRDDDMIVSGGENVFPQEIEELLAQHRSITEAAVVGVPDEEFGHRLRAFVVRRDDLDADAVKAYVRQNLARYKVPREIIFVAELPRNPAGKVLKRALTEPRPT